MISKKLQCDFYRHQSSSREPVREWLRSLSKEEKQTIGEDICCVQMAWPKGPPLVKSLEGGLYEVRSSCPSGEFRVFFCIIDSTMVLLHGIHKKAQATPKGDLELARKRQKEVES